MITCRSNPCIGLVFNEDDLSYEVHLINPTNTDYVRIYTLTGAYASVDDGLVETGKVTGEKGRLRPRSSILLERGDYEELDFVMWYHVDLYKEGSRWPRRRSFHLPKYHWQQKSELLPILEKEGIPISLVRRFTWRTIETEVKNMDMEGKFWPSSHS